MSNEKDLFAPPTQEELDEVNGDMFAPPTKEELKALNPSKEVKIEEQPKKENISSFDKIIESLKGLENYKGSKEKGEAFTRGVTSGATLGFKDELKGALDAAGTALGIKGNQGPTLDLDTLLNSYRSGRDVSRAEDTEATKDHSGVNFLGSALGSLPLTAVNTIKGAAGIGALGGLGGSEADLTQGDYLGAATDTAIGGALGGALQAIPTGMSKLGDYLEGKAERMAVKAVGGGVKEFKDLPRAQQLGRGLLDSGVVSPLASTETMLSRAEDLASQGGKKMGEAYSAIDNAQLSKFNPLEVASEFDAVAAPKYRTPINKSETQQLENTIESILARSNKGGTNNLPLKDAQALKEEIGAVAYPGGNRPLNPTDKQLMAQEAYKVVNKNITDSAQKGADALGHPDILEKLLSGKKEYGVGDKASDLLNTKRAKEINSGGFKGIGDFALSKYNQIGATGLNAVSKILPNEIRSAQPVANPLIQSLVKPKGVEFNDTASVGKEIEKNPSSISSKARELGMNSLADKLDEMSQLPEEQKSQRMFLLMQTPSFRKLINPNGSGSNE